MKVMAAGQFSFDGAHTQHLEVALKISEAVANR